MSVRPGTRLDGRYRLDDQLADGRTGEVWRGTDEVLRRQVAVKVLHRDLAADEEFVRRFGVEARRISDLAPLGIAGTYDVGEVGDQGYGTVVYLVMELVRGRPLSSLLAGHGALGSEHTIDLIEQAAVALHAAHGRGVVHGNLTPTKMLITPEDRMKLIGFGPRRPGDREPRYLAPELAHAPTACPLSDVYALGVVTYQCLAGHLPLRGDARQPPLLASIPEPLRAAITSATHRDPRHRTPSTAAFATALAAARDDREPE